MRDGLWGSLGGTDADLDEHTDGYDCDDQQDRRFDYLTDAHGDSPKGTSYIIS